MVNSYKRCSCITKLMSIFNFLYYFVLFSYLFIFARPFLDLSQYPSIFTPNDPLEDILSPFHLFYLGST